MYASSKNAPNKDHKNWNSSNFSNTLSEIIDDEHAPMRVIISCPEKHDSPSMLVLLPKSIEDLLFIGGKKFGFQPTMIVTKDGALVDDMSLIGDDDHLFLVSDGYSHHAPLKVTISCPEKCNSTSNLVPLPKSIEELLFIGGKKFGFQPTKVVTKDGGEVDDLSLIRDGDHLFLVSDSYSHAPLRVTISCPEKCNSTSKLMPLPKSIEELLFIVGKKFGFQPTNVVTKDGAEVDDMRLIRDDDHLFLVSDFWNGRNSSILKFVKKYIGNYIWTSIKES